jgi:hypothetical protein
MKTFTITSIGIGDACRVKISSDHARAGRRLQPIAGKRRFIRTPTKALPQILVAEVAALRRQRGVAVHTPPQVLSPFSL